MDELDFVEVKPAREDTVGGILGDIDCRIVSGIPSYDWKNYRDEDKVTWAHEGTHAINAYIRNTFNSKNGYYLLDSKGVTLSNPDLTLRDVAEAIPEENRGKNGSPIYKNYLIDQQKYWNDSPFYVIDEISAYLNGTLVGIDEPVNVNRISESYKFCIEMYYFCEVAQELARRIMYEEQAKLDALMAFFDDEIEEIAITLKNDHGLVYDRINR